MDDERQLDLHYEDEDMDAYLEYALAADQESFYDALEQANVMAD